ncbi:MAG: sigma-70 family RNA polymerase sigma factor [Gemmatimonadota bacterium]
MAREREDVLDELLVLRCQGGDERALEMLVQRWNGRILAYSARLTGSSQAAPDVTQEVWMAVVRGIRRLGDPARFRGWLFRIAAHKCADWVRAQQRGRRVLEAAAVERVAVPAPGSREDSDPRLTLLRDALQKLPDNRRTILAMFYLEEMSVKQISSVLSVPAGTVKSRLFHARTALKEKLEEGS